MCGPKQSEILTIKSVIYAVLTAIDKVQNEYPETHQYVHCNQEDQQSISPLVKT
jgi:hypothetical protein